MRGASGRNGPAWMRVGLAAALAVAEAACGGGSSAAPSDAAAAVVATADHREGSAPTLRERAEQGLSISPVPVHTTGFGEGHRLLVGLGSYIVNAASDCAGCHSGPAGFLSGGNPFPLDGAGHVVFSRNLTPDPATGLPLTFPQFLEAIRTGRDFHAGQTAQLVVMPWTTLRWSSALDLAAIYAYLRAIPAVSNAVPPDVKSDLPLPASIPFPGRAYTDGDIKRRLSGELTSFGAVRGLEISPLAQPRIPLGQVTDYGRGSYIANATAHCNDCHTHPDRTADQRKVNTADFLTGGTVFNTPPPLQPLQRTVRATSANLKGATNGFFNEPDDTFARFGAIMSTGTLVDETPARPLAFPMNLVAPNLAKLLPGDLRAVYTYVKNAPSTVSASDVLHQPPARWCAADADCSSGETCATATNECVGGACSADLDCGTCQTCGGGACQAPAVDSVCVAGAQ